MKKILVILLLSVIIASCAKENDNGYGCVYGKNKLTGEREYLTCMHKETYSCGNNTPCVNNSVMAHGGTSLIAYWASHSNFEFSSNPDCNCQ